jgi:hypothetical protein
LKTLTELGKVVCLCLHICSNVYNYYNILQKECQVIFFFFVVSKKENAHLNGAFLKFLKDVVYY